MPDISTPRLIGWTDNITGEEIRRDVEEYVRELKEQDELRLVDL